MAEVVPAAVSQVLRAVLNNEGEVANAATDWLQRAGSDPLHVLRPPHDRHAMFYSSFCAGTSIEASCLRAAVEALARGTDEVLSPERAAEVRNARQDSGPRDRLH